MFEALIIIIPVLFFAFYSALSQWQCTTDYGPDIARQLWPRNLMIALVATLLVTLNNPSNRPYIVLIFALIVLILWLTWVIHLLRKSDDSQILLRWKRPRPTSEIVLAVVLALAGVASMIYGLVYRPVKMDYVFFGLLFISAFPVLYFQKEARLTEKGVETGRDYIRWEQVEAYHWSKYEKPPLTQVFFKTSRRLPAVILVQLDLPLDKKAAVNKIVLQKVQQIPGVTEKTSLTS
ncbi:hypothetical protein TFLX_04197 [Thermoflexales bacterium]|nr:hypothetical protein TFLX_04197 [Thermoflexales bacterium]